MRRGRKCRVFHGSKRSWGIVYMSAILIKVVLAVKAKQVSTKVVKNLR
jgi:hypothetical protein